MPIFSPKLVPAKLMQSETGICAFHPGPKLAAKQTKKMSLQVVITQSNRQ